MAKPGFIAIFRQLQDHDLWKEKPFDKRSAWIDIILSAQFHDSSIEIGGNTIDIKRGSWFVSITTLENRWGWSRNKVRNYIRYLERDGMLTTKRYTKGYVLTVVNYEKFQSVGTAKGTSKGTDKGTDKGISEGTSKGTYTNNTNKGNKVTKKKKTSPMDQYTFSEEEIQHMIEVDPKNEEYFREAMRRQREET